MSEVLLKWNDASFGTVRAVYANESEAVEQALHDMALGRDVFEVQDAKTGATLWSRNQLETALLTREKNG